VWGTREGEGGREGRDGLAKRQEAGGISRKTGGGNFFGTAEGREPDLWPRGGKAPPHRPSHMHVTELTQEVTMGRLVGCG
jgi:hypothetical protein